jgi:general secretion pathway protein C
MELLFRKHSWTINLLFVVLVALIVARTASFFIESKIAVLSPVGVQTIVQRHRAVESVATLPKERLAALIGLPIPHWDSQVVEPAQRAVDPKAPATKSALRVKLLGTLLATAPEWSVASVLDTSTNESGTYMVGDRLQGAEVLEIERRRVIVLNNGRREFIDDQPGDGPPIAGGRPEGSPVAAASPVNTTSAAGPGQGIRAISENEYEVSKTEIDLALGDLYSMGMQVRFVPVYKDGVANGLKLLAIRPNSLFTKIGILNGDVIKRINGFDLNSAEKALEIYSKLKESNRIDIEVERNGSLLRKTYNVR